MARKYGYKPRSHSISGLGVRELLNIHLSPLLRMFSVPFGRHTGESRWAKGIPWAGATAGAGSTSEAIEKLKKVNPGVGARCEAFAADASKAKGNYGTVLVQYLDTGQIAPIPAAAYARLTDPNVVMVGVLRPVGIARRRGWKAATAT